jgi:acyl-CoA synthetase (AMP-forming)/AMP-acid ligase II/aryl carrier-like protein
MGTRGVPVRCGRHEAGLDSLENLMTLQASDVRTVGTLGDMLRQRSAAEPEKVGFVFLASGEEESSSLTWRQLDAAARAVAQRLRETCPAGERALLLYPAGLDFISAFLGCLYAGVVAIPAPAPRSARHERALPRLRTIVDDARPAVVLSSAAIGAVVEEVIGEVAAGLPCVHTDQLGAGESFWTPPEASANELAFLQYTSGSTSAPKGVMVSHANLMHNLGSMRRAFRGSPQATGVSWLPHYHDMGLLMQLQALYCGCRCVVMPPAAFLQQPARWLRAVSRYRAVASGGPNFAYALCARSVRDADCQGLDLSGWKLAYNAAEPIDARTMQAFAERFAPWGFSPNALFPAYGLAEATLLVSSAEYGEGVQLCTALAARQGDDLAAAADAPAAKTWVRCGRARGGQRVVIVQPQSHQRCAPGEVGEVWVQGPSVAGGYWAKAALTAEVFGARLSDGDGPYLRTGDLGFFHGEELVITGRLKDLIIVRGVNHYPQDIELTAGRSHAALAEGGGAAFSVPLDGQECLVVVHELERSRRDADVNEVAQAVRQALAEQHELTLHALVLLKPGHLPRTSSGKVRRGACREDYLNGRLPEAGRWERPEQPFTSPDVREQGSAAQSTPPAAHVSHPMTLDEMSLFLTRLLAEAAQCPIEEIDPAEPFVRYGLDSAAAMSLAEAIRAGLGLDALSQPPSSDPAGATPDGGEGPADSASADELSPTIFWDYPSVETLASYLVDRQAKRQAAGEA